MGLVSRDRGAQEEAEEGQRSVGGRAARKCRTQQAATRPDAVGKPEGEASSGAGGAALRRSHAEPRRGGRVLRAELIRAISITSTSSPASSSAAGPRMAGGAADRCDAASDGEESKTAGSSKDEDWHAPGVTWARGAWARGAWARGAWAREAGGARPGGSGGRRR